MTRSAPKVSNESRGFFEEGGAFDTEEDGTSIETEPYVVITISMGRVVVDEFDLVPETRCQVPPPPPPPQPEEDPLDETFTILRREDP